MTVTDEAVDLAMAALPDRHARSGRRELARAEVYRMLKAAEPALCAGAREQIHQQLGGWAERVHMLPHTYEQVDDHPDVLRAFGQLENDLTGICDKAADQRVQANQESAAEPTHVLWGCCA